MGLNLFGFEISKKKQEDILPLQNFTTPEEFDGAYVTEGAGVYGTFVDFMGSQKNDNALIAQYRAMALFPECDTAIDEITNESIVMGSDRKPIKLDLSKIEFSDNIKSKMYFEFDNILKLLDFHDKGFEIFRRWYIDSKLFYYITINTNNPNEGIRQLIPLDATKIKKVRKVKTKNAKQDGASLSLIQDIEEYYLYTNTDKNSVIATPTSGLKISPDSICFVHSGMVDMNTKRVIGYLHKAIRPLNMLRQNEDAIVVYRISRAPERRIFYIDVGNLPKQKAEQYVRELMNKYRNKMIYNQTTGEMKDDRNQMAMIEDYWLPRREGGRGTEITTLPGGQTLGEMDDVLYFQKKLYQTLNVPVNRLNSDALFSLGRATEVTRDELKFGKFITRLRGRFSALFTSILEKQLVLKGIMTLEDWQKIAPKVKYDYAKDNYFTELKDAEIYQNRAQLLMTFEQGGLLGKYYSHEWARRNILQQSDDEIEEQDEKIAEEQDSGDPRWAPPPQLGPDGQPMDPNAQMQGQPSDPSGGSAEDDGEQVVDDSAPAAPSDNKASKLREAQQIVDTVSRKDPKNRTLQDEAKYRSAVQLLSRNK